MGAFTCVRRDTSAVVEAAPKHTVDALPSIVIEPSAVAVLGLVGVPDARTKRQVRVLREREILQTKKE